MKRFEVEVDGKRYEVEAATERQAVAAAKRMQGSRGGDIAKGLGSGVLKGLAGIVEGGPLGAMTKGANAVLSMTGARARVPTPDKVFGAYGANYQPKTTAGEYAKAVGTFAPDAALPGGMVRRAAAVLAPALTSETAGQVARRAGAGPMVEGAARGVGGLVGGIASGVRMAPAAQRSPVNAVVDRAPQDVGAMRARMVEMRGAGIEPALVDVVDDGGRGMIRAAASRPVARQPAQEFADARVVNLPDRISQQARRTMSADPRNPLEIAEELGTQRRAQADSEFGAIRGERLGLTPEVVRLLRTDEGLDAIRDAARRERDPDIRRELLMLSDNALDDPSTEITVGMADRLRRVLASRQQANLGANPDRDLAGLYGDAAREVSEAASGAVPAYRSALDNYAAQSRLMEAADRGQDFLARNTDEYVADVARMTPEEIALARATGRRAVERAAGENVSAAPGVARKLANAPEQQTRNRALLGADAPAFEQGMRLEAEAVRNGLAIAPGTGSQTQLRQSEAERLAGGAELAVQAARGDFIGMGMNWLKTRGLSDTQAQRLVEMAIDPAQTERAIAILESRIGRNEVLQFLRLRAVAIGATPALAATDESTEPPQ